MPSSVRSSLRSSRRAESHSLGLEDELSFGSDEDLMETIGEIPLPEDEQVPDLPQQPTKERRPKSSKSSRTLKHKHKESRSSSSSSLASSTHLLPPLPPVPSGSMLDLPMDMFGEREKHKRGSLMGAFKVKGLRKWRDDQSSKASFITDSQSQGSTVSLHKMDSNISSRLSVSSSAYHNPAAAQPPHLAPINLLSYDSEAKQYEDKRPAAQAAQRGAGPVVNGNASIASGRSWTPSEISSAILPSFPASTSALEPITVLTAQAAKRPQPSILSSKQPPAAVRWTPCTLVFTLFKVHHVEDDERTVAHIHVFASKTSSPAPSPTIRRSKSNAGLDAATPRVETERRYLTRAATASVCDDVTDANGRAVVLRVIFGDEDRTKGNEWLLEMKDAAQLQEYIRQIKKTAIMINAEELGYGRAIRPAFDNSSVSADELAQKLSVHARSVAERRDAVPAPNAIAIPGKTPSTTSEEERRSIDAVAGAALSRSKSADDAPRRKSAERKPVEPSTEHEDDSIGIGGLNLGSAFPTPPSALPNSSLSFPAPPSDLPKSALSFPAPPSNVPVRPPREAPPAQATQSATASALLAQSVQPVQPAQAVQTAPAAPVLPSPSPDSDEEDFSAPVRPPTPPRRAPARSDERRNPSPPAGRSTGSTPTPARAGSVPPAPAVQALQVQAQHRGTPSVSSNNSANSSTHRLRRLRGKPQVIDIMAEFSQVEADHNPPQPAEEEEPIRDDRERRIRFAGV